jgi:hypothetical protein
MLGTSNDCSEATVCLSFQVVEQATTSDLQDRTHTNCAGHTSVARLQNPYSCLPRRTYSHRSVREKNQINRVVEGMSTCRPDWLLGLPLYHISRHVASTFKRLATTTTHFDLKTFIKTDRVSSGHDTAHDPVHHPYNGCRIVNKQLLYRASDRKSPDFYRSYLAEHLSDKDSGTLHRVPKILCN